MLTLYPTVKMIKNEHIMYLILKPISKIKIVYYCKWK